MTSYKKSMFKNLLYILLIIFVACFLTYKIYDKFHTERSINYTTSSKALDIEFHEDTGNKINLDGTNPLPDNLGLSTNPYIFTIENNLTEEANVIIKIDDNTKKMNKIADKQIPKKYIKVSIKTKGHDTDIYTLDELEDGVLLHSKIDALSKEKYTIRLWVSSEIDTTNTDIFYYGKITIKENNKVIARR